MLNIIDTKFPRKGPDTFKVFSLKNNRRSNHQLSLKEFLKNVQQVSDPHLNLIIFILKKKYCTKPIFSFLKFEINFEHINYYIFNEFNVRAPSKIIKIMF